MPNSEQFLKAFNEIERIVRKQSTSKETSFSSLLREVAGKNNILHFYEEDLREYAELRNAIVHQFKGVTIAEPHDETVRQISHIYEKLTCPPTALAIASKPVVSCRTDDSIADRVETMVEQVYTSIPVYEKSEFIGVFSESSITKWLASSAENDGFILEGTKIGSLRKHLDRPDDKFNSYKFVSRNTDIISIQEDFLSFVEAQKRLGAIFVTETGRQSEKLLGIITAWDLPKIKKLLW